MGLSLNPETFVTGGLPVGEMEIIGAEYEVYDFGGKANKDFAEPTVLRIDLKLADGSEHPEHLSCGSSDRVIPSPDKDEILPQSDGITGISKNTAVYLFVESLARHGATKSVLSGKASSLIGLKFIATRPPVKGADGETKKRKDSSGREYDQTYFACEKILVLPGEKGGKAKAGAGKATGKTTATAASTKTTTAAAIAAEAPDEPSDEISVKAQEMVMTVLGEAGGSMPVMNLRVKMFAATKSLEAAEKASVLKLINSNEWLGENGFTISGKDISA